MKSLNEVWEEWGKIFEMWKKVSIKTLGFVRTDKDWWLSRFADDHTHLMGVDYEELWSCHLAPALGINLGIVQPGLFERSEIKVKILEVKR
jgi:hypothetical protein